MHIDFNRKSAIIVGMEKNGLGVARSLALHDIPCLGLDKHSRNPAHKTRTCSIITTRAWNKEGIIKELRSMGEKFDYKIPLFITKEEPVMWISEAREKIHEFYEINLPSHDIVNLLLDKKQFRQLSQRENWPIPISWEIKNVHELESQIKEFVYPCILKPVKKNTSFIENSPFKTFKIYSQDELIRIYELVSQWQNEVVIQEWIEGKEDRVVFCLAYYDRSGHPISLFAGRKLRQWPIECGNTAIAEPAPKEWIEPILEMTKIIFNKVGFKGIGSIEYKMSYKLDNPIIMEPTVGRTDYQSEVAVLNGQNIPATAYFDLVGSPPIKHIQPVKSYKLICGIREVKAAWKYYCTGNLTLSQWIKDRSGHKKYMLFRLDDPMPFIFAMYKRIRRFMVLVFTIIFGKKIKEKLQIFLRSTRDVERTNTKN
jgi:predicted ATP-grasp superfamily ATP-dependent carboligase